MTTCLFVSDLHGHIDRYQKLFAAIERRAPKVVFLGGDLLPPSIESLRQEASTGAGFINGFMKRGFSDVRRKLGEQYPAVFLILGNDDPRIEEETIERSGEDGLWKYLHGQRCAFDAYTFAGYACVPPSPFRLKDWERYDVSRFVDPGCIPPEDGFFSMPVSKGDLRLRTIQRDLAELVNGIDTVNAIFLFHSPPYETALDRAALDGRMVDHAPVDAHVGSIAIRRFLEQHQPLISLHGHVHESAELTGLWKEKLGRTHIFGAAHAGPELALIQFTLEHPEFSSRDLL